jgi:enoyl-CoA hydratase/carnithine racemase
MAGSQISLKIDSGIALIDFNRAERGNTITRDMMRELTSMLGTLGNDQSVKAIALRPAGASFCEGRDRAGESMKDMTAHAVRTEVLSVILDLYRAVQTTPVPVVACVKGKALGFGAALAGSCDITLSADTARYSFPEIEHKTPPTLAMTAVMRSVQRKSLGYLAYSAEEIDASMALMIGLVSWIFPAQQFDCDVDAFLATLATRPRLTLETIKRFQNKAATLDSDMMSEYAGTLMALVRTAI